MKTHYTTLSAHRGTKTAELKAKWRVLAFALHPDRPEGDKDRFAEASEAYHTLSDSKLRVKYDQELALLTIPCRTCEGKGFTYTQQGFTRTPVACAECEGCGRQERAKSLKRRI
jgi:DnaJ-class molecular chaperone